MTINVPSSLWWLPCRGHSEGGKNSLWEKQETEQWHGVKNLLLGWHLSRILPGTFILLPSNLCIWKKTPTFVSVFSFISSFLSSRAASGQVLSAFVSLTSVFGMDTGDPHSYRHCFSERLFSQNHIEEVLKLFACLGVSKLRPRPISFMSLQALRLFHS